MTATENGKLLLQAQDALCELVNRGPSWTSGFDLGSWNYSWALQIEAHPVLLIPRSISDRQSRDL